ncbi:hypothetical protein LCGC14_2461160 [marine sediment metagenome]|uniref:Uncharacterized protein n=1 Tax=marine sediment metagenome TaxID=412755 RepID=A0A0F9E724_9ZZZZ
MAGSINAIVGSEDMNTVYRIQSKQDRTRGAYDVGGELAVRSDVVKQMHDAHGKHSEGNIHPSPYYDIKRPTKRNEYCGCSSAAALLRWFKGFIPDLLRAGYEIVALSNVEITAVGEYQVLFKWRD